MGIGKIFSDAAKLLMMGIGVSDAGTIPRKIDLWKMVYGGDWQLHNCAASNVNHKGKEAVRLTASGSEGLALYNALEFFNCKIDLSLTGVSQKVGLAVRAKSESEFEVVSFGLDTKAQTLRLELEFGSRTTTVELPSQLLGEWIPVRVVLNRKFTAVFVNGSNMPSLKVAATPEYTSGGRIGFRIEGDAEGLIADLKYIQPRKRDFEDV
jgi:hypothetical protein